MHVCMWSQRTALCAICLYETGFLIGLEVTNTVRLAGQWSLGHPFPLFHLTGKLYKGSHLGSLASKASILLTEPSSQPWLMFLFPENGSLGTTSPTFFFLLHYCATQANVFLAPLPLLGCSLPLGRNSLLGQPAVPFWPQGDFICQASWWCQMHTLRGGQRFWLE